MPAYNYKFQEDILISFRIVRKNCCGLDAHKTWIFDCENILPFSINNSKDYPLYCAEKYYKKPALKLVPELHVHI